MEILDNLNPQQQQAVTAGDGRVLVLAGPGSGKTRVLTRRVAYLIQNMNVPPYDILAMTFTNKAARVMKDRLADMLGPQGQSVWVGTFHSVCARILRQQVRLLPFTANFVIYDADDQLRLMKQVVKDMGLDEKNNRPGSLLNYISQAKNNLILPDEYEAGSDYRQKNVKIAYERYQNLLQANNALDFDDLLLWAVRLLLNREEAREFYSRQFQHVLVDEFQDTNQVQYELLKLFSYAHGNLFAVGDEDQSIYRWRGADYRNVMRFEEDYPECQKILLEENYRSTQLVLDAAQGVINRNTNRTPKHLFTQNDRGARIILHEAEDDQGEAQFVVDTIRHQLENKTARGSDFAIMYRTNAQSRRFEEAFLHAGMSYTIVGAQRFYGRREVKDIIAYLYLVYNPADELSLGRVINVPSRKIGAKSLEALADAAHQAGLRQQAVLIELGSQQQKSPYWDQMGRAAPALSGFGRMLATWQQKAQELELPALFDAILEDIDYRGYLLDGTEEGESRWENVQELRKQAYEYRERGLSEFLENLALVSDQDTLQDKGDSPTLLTLHAAKGLEFNQVFITGLDECLLPHSRSFDEPEEMAEERRLFYVGMTRTRQQLYLVRAEQRFNYGAPSYSQPSRFLTDIQENLLQHDSSGRSVRFTTENTAWQQPERWTSSTRWPGSTGSHPGVSDSERQAPPMHAKPVRGKSKTDSSWKVQRRPAADAAPSHKPAPRPAAQPKAEPKFKAGMKVRHEKLGPGEVRQSIVDANGEEVVTVYFSEQEREIKILTSFAKLDMVK
jgi:DNA helicase-2/ATP-dependent DNA helicase PcrA